MRILVAILLGLASVVYVIFACYRKFTGQGGCGSCNLCDLSPEDLVDSTKAETEEEE